jgi:hypothetical protein
LCIALNQLAPQANQLPEPHNWFTRLDNRLSRMLNPVAAVRLPVDENGRLFVAHAQLEQRRA